jgi:non-ribosomal peptide synthetase component E (peptide arylation enzyme)
MLAASPPEGLDAEAVVRVTGTVQMVQRESFEEDFGLVEDELFDDPEAFFAEAEGQPAIAATEVEILQAEGADS